MLPCVHSLRMKVLTGAGCSTESGIPDYRSPNGSYSVGHKPVTHQEFVSSEAVRKRYWARSLAGWRYFHEREPNASHLALKELQDMKYVGSKVHTVLKVCAPLFCFFFVSIHHFQSSSPVIASLFTWDHFDPKICADNRHAKRRRTAFTRRIRQHGRTSRPQLCGTLHEVRRGV